MSSKKERELRKRYRAMVMTMSLSPLVPIRTTTQGMTSLLPESKHKGKVQIEHENIHKVTRSRYCYVKAGTKQTVKRFGRK
jgi:hypothetical protein